MQGLSWREDPVGAIVWIEASGFTYKAIPDFKAVSILIETSGLLMGCQVNFKLSPLYRANE
jgi:hypothetical protein